MPAKKARKTGGKRKQVARKSSAKLRGAAKKSAPARGRAAKAGAKKVTKKVAKKSAKKAAKGRSGARGVSLKKKAAARKTSPARPAKPVAKAPVARKPRSAPRGSEPIAQASRRLQSLAKDRPAKHLREEAGVGIETPVPGHGEALNVQAAGAVDVFGLVQARDLAREEYSERSKGQRLKNIHAATADTRIRGHAMGAHRAAQAKRDAQQGGE